MSPAQATIKYSLPGKGGVKTSLLSAEDDEDEDDFDDANDGDNILEIVSKKWCHGGVFSKTRCDDGVVSKF